MATPCTCGIMGESAPMAEHTTSCRRRLLIEARAHRAAGLGLFGEGRCSFCRRSAHYQTPSGAYLCEICGEPDA